MSALLTPRRPGRARERDTARTSDRQETLFSGVGTFEPSTPVEPSPDQGKAVHDAHDVPLAQPAALRAPTLDEAITAMWGDLLAGTATTCPVCGSEAMQPRHSAGAGVVGGRCGACDSTLA